ncbi:MAG TPA: hypothetical protein VGZ93_04285 [Candidatus Methylacidiphilales bacterium]|nr:hypothetical protein [Candidatus Methylacidiphilales bacterium]
MPEANSPMNSPLGKVPKKRRYWGRSEGLEAGHQSSQRNCESHNPSPLKAKSFPAKTMKDTPDRFCEMTCKVEPRYRREIHPFPRADRKTHIPGQILHHPLQNKFFGSTQAKQIQVPLRFINLGRRDGTVDRVFSDFQ